MDSLDPEGVRFMAVDGRVEEPVFFTADGLDPALLPLFTDGRTIRPRRIVYRPEFVGSPFYPIKQHILARDVAGPQ